MTINLSVPERYELKPRITVFGVGGAGGNAVNNMIECGLEGVEFVVANTDAQALSQSKAHRRIQMGESATQGLGAGSHPEVGRGSAQEAIDEIRDHLSGCHMVFVTAGMGGGTGTGAAPIIAQAAKEMGILTVAVVTKPFQFEGSRRMRIAQEGLAELEKYVDTLLVIPNQNLFRVANAKTTFAEAFAMADQVLFSGVGGITDLMVAPGLINLDFADVRAVMGGAGTAMMGTGEATGENRANEAAEAAISNPLLEDVSMAGARGVLINIVGGSDLTLYEVDEAANRVRAEVDPDANIIVGSTFDPNLDGRMRVSVVATGVRSQKPILTVVEPVRASVHPTVSGHELSPEDTVVLVLETAEEEPVPTMDAPDEIDDADTLPAVEAFIPPVAVHPQEQPRLVTAKDPVMSAPDSARSGEVGRQSTGLLARLGLFNRNKSTSAKSNFGNRVPPTLRRGEQDVVSNDSDQRDACSAPLTAKEEELLEIPAFLRRSAN